MRGIFFVTICYLLSATCSHAGVRVQGLGGEEGIKDSVLINGSGFGSTPLPGAVSLPGAASLELEPTPPVSPTTPLLSPLAASATLVTTPSATLSVTASGTELIAGEVTVTPAGPPRNATQIQTCRKSLQLLAETTVAGYTRAPHDSYMEILAAATVLDAAVTGDIPGDIGPLIRALGRLPWRGVLRKEIQQAGKLAQTFCAPIGGWRRNRNTDVIRDNSRNF